MRAERIRPGPLTPRRADQLFSQLDQLSRDTWMTATYPILLDLTWAGWVISFDVSALRAGQTVINPVNNNPINPVDGGQIDDFNPQDSDTVILEDSTGPTTITGFLPAPPGSKTTILNNTDYPVYIEYLDPSSSTDGQIITPTKTTLVIPPCGTADLVYGKGPDKDKWAVVSPTPPIYYPIVVPQITADQNALNPGDTATDYAITSDATRTVNGIVNGPNYQIKTIVNTGSFDILFPHDSTSASDPSYRFWTPSGDTVTLRPKQSLSYYYDPGLDRNVIIGGTANMFALTEKAVPQFLAGKLQDSPLTVPNGTDVECSGHLTADYVKITQVSAPADGDLNASEAVYWLDDTVGATKIKFKAKDSGGTVRTGEVALS